MQVEMHNSAWAAPKNIVKTNGVKGLYAGIFTLIYREIPFDTIQMLIYEYLKGGRDLNVQTSMLNGAFAGGVSAFITTPIDVVKTRLMTDGGKGVYKSFSQSLKLIAAQDGIAKLWSGWHVRVFYTTIGGMMFFGTFEAVIKAIKSK